MDRKILFLGLISCFVAKGFFSSLYCFIFSPRASHNVSMPWVYQNNNLSSNLPSLHAINMPNVHDICSVTRSLAHLSESNLPLCNLHNCHKHCDNSTIIHCYGKFPQLQGQQSNFPPTLTPEVVRRTKKSKFGKEGALLGYGTIKGGNGYFIKKRGCFEQFLFHI